MFSGVEGRFWRFVQGKESTAEFEAWVYASRELESGLDPGFYLDLLSTDFHDARATSDLKRALLAWLVKRGFPTCECYRWGERETPGWTRVEQFLARSDVLRQRTDRLECRRCRGCGRAWSLALDEVRDERLFRRLSEREVQALLEEDRWPADFDGVPHNGLNKRKRWGWF